MRKKTRMCSFLLAWAMCASLLAAPAWAADDRAPVVWTDKIGKGTAKIVTVPMGDGRTGEISLANNSVVEAVKAKTLIDQKNNRPGTHVVAAINGGFFNSYTSGTPSFPDNCPLIMNAVVADGKLIRTGRTAMLGFTAGGTAMVDWVLLKGQVKLGNGFTPAAWSVNTYESDPAAVMLFDEHLTLPVTIPSSSTMFRIQNGVITKVEAGGVLRVAKGENVLVYNKDTADQERGWSRIPTEGMSAQVTFSASGTGRDEAWNGVETALTGGPVLVKDGKNVVDDERNQAFYGDSKQKPDTALARSFVGITANGGLVMGTVPSATFRQIADWMVKNGIQEGIAMDGGGSCMLYAEGSGYLSVGRDLAAALVIVDRTGKGGLPAESNVGDPDCDIPDSWAAADIKAAIDLGFVMQTLQRDYKANITRQEFCTLIDKLVRTSPDFVKKLYANPEVTFTDVDHSAYEGMCVGNVARLGIVGGVGSGRFDPNGELTRGQAAKILALTAQYFGVEDTGEQYPFPDRAAIPSYFTQYTDFCGVNGILKGTTGNRFDAYGKFTRQQAIATIMRIYRDYAAK